MKRIEDERVAGATLKERTVGRGWQLFEPIDAAYERGEIGEAEWHRRVGAIIGPAYLAASPVWLVGHSGRVGTRAALHLRGGEPRRHVPRRWLCQRPPHGVRGQVVGRGWLPD